MALSLVDITVNKLGRSANIDSAIAHAAHDFKYCHIRFLRLRSVIEIKLNPGLPRPSSSETDFVSSLVHLAMDETMGGGPYHHRDVLKCSRGPVLQYVYRILKKVRGRPFSSAA